MSANEVHKGDIGTIFEATIKDGSEVIDVSTATTKQLIFRKPDGETAAQDAAFTTDGTDGKIRYTILTDDLDQAGNWQLQAKVILSSGTWFSDIADFVVYSNLV